MSPRPLLARLGAGLLSLVLVACGGAAPDPSVDPSSSGASPAAASTPAASTPAASGTDEAMAAAIAEADAIFALEPAARDARIAERTAALELDVAELSGLADALGGREAAATALAAAWGPIIDTIRDTPFDTARRSGATTVAFRTVAADTSIGAGLFGGLLLVSLGAQATVEASNNLSGDAPQQGSPDGHPETVVELTTGKASLRFDASHESGGLKTSLKTAVEVLPCPGTDGTWTAKGSMTIETSAGKAGQNGTLEVTVTGHVDDDARPLESEASWRMEWAKFGDVPGQFIDVSGTPTAVTVNRTGGAATAQFASETAATGRLLALMIQVYLEKAAQSGWESGRCVRLDATPDAGPSGLTPGQAVSIAAMPRSKLDGAPAGGTVTATLASGGASVDPAGTKVQADATFTYTAPGETGQRGSVDLVARSRRGVGKASIAFDTGGGWTASGSSGGVTFSGTVASLGQPFTIDISFPGSDSGAFAFDAATPDGGSIAINASGSGATLTGSGTYTVADNGDGTKTITAKTRSCVDVSKVCRSSTHQILLTPTR